MSTPESPSPSAGSDLPVHLTRFVGRGHELDELVRLVDAVRLVTLTGAGGSGKTRLAREAAARLAPRFGRVAWADLAPLSDPELVPQQVCAALRVPEGAGPASPGERAAEALGDGEVLLVLDNCEHLVDACAAFVDALLRACPGLRILATSREALGVEGETAWLVPPMACSEALDLFADRARRSLPSFAVSEDNTPVLHEICARLDGIPLAIELAAARVRVLSPEQISERLDDAFRLLSSGSRTAVPRHRTLRATMEWSYGLLSAREQALLARLAVFHGSFSLEAAEAVCAGGALDVDDILDGVTALVDRSLVVKAPGEGAARYRLLETVRQYGSERLDEAGDREPLERRWAEHFLAALEAAAPGLEGGANDPGLVARLGAELDNLRAAAAWSVAEPERAELGLRFAGASFWICYAFGLFREARSLIDRALALGGAAGPLLRGRALASSALTALAQGDYERSVADFEAALPLLRAGGDPRAEASARAKLGAARLLGGDADGAARGLDEALASLRGWADHDIAVVFARFWRGSAAYVRGELDLAAELLRANERVGRDRGLPTTLAHALATLARVELARGRMEEARALAAESLERQVAIHDGWGVALALDVVAMIAARTGRAEPAVRLLAGTEAHRRRLAVALPGPAPAEREDVLERLRVELGRRFEPLLAEGMALSTDALVRIAREEVGGAAGGFADGGVADAPTTVAAAAAPARATVTTAAGPAGEARVRVEALGPLRVTIGGEPVDPSAWGSARTRELLVHLLLHPEGRTKEQVGLAFWPDASPGQLRNNFHVTLHRLRRALGGADRVTLAQERYRMEPALLEGFDAAELERDLARARRELRRQGDGAAAQVEAALALYRGDLLDGEPAGDWHLEHRDRLRRLYLEAAMELGAHHARGERHAEAADAYRRVLARDELHEEALRGLVQALVDGGDRSEALRAYQRFSDRLRAELAAEPHPLTLRLLERIRGAGVA